MESISKKGRKSTVLVSSQGRLKSNPFSNTWAFRLAEPKSDRINSRYKVSGRIALE
jgi:hypothetical protein